ncbi:MAG: VOC family protein [Erysipelotrichaceae bacterium]
MQANLFVNLPVNDLHVTMQFYSKLGFVFTPFLSDEHVASMIVNASCVINFMEKEYFQTLTRKRLVNTDVNITSMLAIEASSKEEVDAFVEQAVALGGHYYNRRNMQAHMYEWSFEDLDGHVWQVLWIDRSMM